MDFQLRYTKRAKTDIAVLDSVAKKRLNKALLRFALDPYLYSKKLTNHDIGDYRFRVGNYRLIFNIVANEIIIQRVGHRGEIYR